MLRRSLLSLLALSAALLAAPALADFELEGTVTGLPDQEPIEDARVTVRAKTADGSDSPVLGEDTTDRKGRFEIELDDPAPGDYIVRFEAEGWSPLEGDMRVEEGSLGQEVNVELVDAEAGQRQKAIDLYNEAATFHSAQDLDAALPKFEAAAEADPTLAPAWLAIADVRLRVGDTEGAIEAIERFRALEPEDEQGLRVAFEVYRQAGDREKAEGLAEQLGGEDMSKDLAIGIYNEGAVASQKGDYETALAKFREAAELDPTLAEAYAGIASILYNQEDLAGALAAAEKTLEIDPEHVRGRRMRFLAYDAQGDTAKIWETWEAYKEVDPDGATELLYNRAKLEFEAGNNPFARAALEKVLAVDPDHPRAHYTLGLTYTSDDPAKAREHLQKFIALAPDDPEVPTAKEILSYLE